MSEQTGRVASTAPRVRGRGEDAHARPYSMRLLQLATGDDRRRLSSSGRGRKVAVTHGITDDPFQVTGMYGIGPRKFVLPPLGEGSLRALVQFRDESNVLPQCIAAFKDNIDGFGHRFDTAVKEEQFPDAKKAEAEKEREVLEAFFEYAYSEGSFIALRKKVRDDLETTGIGYIEIARDLVTGNIERLNHVPSWQVRMTGLDPQWVIVTEMRRIGLELVPTKIARQFRLYCQIVVIAGKMRRVWFKEFGDPRRLNVTTGEWIPARAPRMPNEATELMVARNYHAVSGYGLPRWIGNLPSVLGSRAAEEINLLYFDNKTVPPLVIAVAGGQLTKGTLERIRDVIEYEIKGRENFHNALIIEAVNPEAGAGRQAGARPTIDIKPLTDRMQQDAMFMGYDKGNREKARGSFRLPPLLIGETQDYTRATAAVSILTAEEQVFRPERKEYDYSINRWLLPQLGAQYLKMTSLGPNVTLNEDMIALITSAEAAGGMTPNLAREIMADVMERDVPMIEEDWGNLPYSLTRAEVSIGALMEELVSVGTGRGGRQVPVPPPGLAQQRGGPGGGAGPVTPSEAQTEGPSVESPEAKPDEAEPDKVKRARRWAVTEVLRFMSEPERRAFVGRLQSAARKELARRGAVPVQGEAREHQMGRCRWGRLHAKDNPCHDPETGEFCSGLGGLLTRLREPDGGFTVHPVTGKEPTQGYAVAIYPDRSNSEFTAATLTGPDVMRYISKNWDVLSKPEHFFGAWHDPKTGKVWLDISVVKPSEAAVEQLARQHNQIAYFDLGKGHSVDVVPRKMGRG